MITIPNRTNTASSGALDIMDANMRQISEDAQRDIMSINNDLKNFDKNMYEVIAKLKQQFSDALNEEVAKLVTIEALPTDVKALFNDDINLGDGSCTLKYNGTLKIGGAPYLVFDPAAERFYICNTSSKAGVSLKVWDGVSGGDQTVFTVGTTNAWINGYKIVDSGSNWIRFYDGTQICWGTNHNATDNGPAVVSLPVTYVDTNYIATTAAKYYSSTYITLETSVSYISSSSFYIYMRKSDGGAIHTIYASWMTIGRWK